MPRRCRARSPGPRLRRSARTLRRSRTPFPGRRRPRSPPPRAQPSPPRQRAQKTRGQAGRREASQAADVTAARAGAIPLTVLTGFLGAGKTTLINRLVREPELAGTLVLVNEIGEIGLDHLLMEQVEGDVIALAGGCLCCTVRSDLIDTLEDLLLRRDRGRDRAVRARHPGNHGPRRSDPGSAFADRPSLYLAPLRARRRRDRRRRGHGPRRAGA